MTNTDSPKSNERLQAILDAEIPLVMSVTDMRSVITELLSRRAQAQPAGVRVKVGDLQWRENGSTSIWTGELIFGVYYTAYDEGSGWRCFRSQLSSEAGADEIAYGSKDAVLAAAQADYERRIRSALSDAPQGEVEPVAWLVRWTRDGEEWVDAHADEPRAVDQARRFNGECIDLYASPPPQQPVVTSVEALVDKIGEAIYGRHARGFVLWPLVDGPRQREALTSALSHPTGE